MGRNLIENAMGAVVLVVAAWFVVFVYNTVHVGSANGYSVTATFYKIGGLQAGSDVRINGIKVGTVAAQRLDPKTFDAVVDLSISPDIRLPADTVAAIGSDGLLGDKYVRLEPGTATDVLTAGARITRTRDYRSLEDQVGEIIFLATGDSSPDAKTR